MIIKKTIDDKKYNFFHPLYLDPALPLPYCTCGPNKYECKMFVLYSHIFSFM